MGPCTNPHESPGTPGTALGHMAISPDILHALAILLFQRAACRLPGVRQPTLGLCLTSPPAVSKRGHIGGSHTGASPPPLLFRLCASSFCGCWKFSNMHYKPVSHTALCTTHGSVIPCRSADRTALPLAVSVSTRSVSASPNTCFCSCPSLSRSRTRVEDAPPAVAAGTNSSAPPGGPPASPPAPPEAAPCRAHVAAPRGPPPPMPAAAAAAADAESAAPAGQPPACKAARSPAASWGGPRAPPARPPPGSQPASCARAASGSSGAAAPAQSSPAPPNTTSRALSACQRARSCTQADTRAGVRLAPGRGLVSSDQTTTSRGGPRPDVEGGHGLTWP